MNTREAAEMTKARGLQKQEDTGTAHKDEDGEAGQQGRLHEEQLYVYRASLSL